MKSYRLLLLSLRKPETAEGIFCSNHMLAWGLWREFSRLPHVTLFYHDSDTALADDLPQVDFAIIHSYFGTRIFSDLAILRRAVARQVLQFCELPLPLNVVDHNFVFLPDGQPTTTYLPCPCIGDLLAQHNAPKVPGSILLDHPWLPFRGTRKDLCPQLYGLLAGRSQVSQLTRSNHDTDHVYPGWISQVQEQGYPGYLDATATAETFILTHPGSYEHSIVDMAARGTRVLVPVLGGKPFAPQPVIDRLGLRTFETMGQLSSLLEVVPEFREPMLQCTDMPQIVAEIDRYCQEHMA